MEILHQTLTAQIPACSKLSIGQLQYLLTSPLPNAQLGRTKVLKLVCLSLGRASPASLIQLNEFGALLESLLAGSGKLKVQTSNFEKERIDTGTAVPSQVAGSRSRSPKKKERSVGQVKVEKISNGKVSAYRVKAPAISIDQPKDLMPSTLSSLKYHLYQCQITNLKKQLSLASSDALNQEHHFYTLMGRIDSLIKHPDSVSIRKKLEGIKKGINCKYAVPLEPNLQDNTSLDFDDLESHLSQLHTQLLTLTVQTTANPSLFHKPIMPLLNNTLSLILPHVSSFQQSSKSSNQRQIIHSSLVDNEVALIMHDLQRKVEERDIRIASIEAERITRDKELNRLRNLLKCDVWEEAMVFDRIQMVIKGFDHLLAA